VSIIVRNKIRQRYIGFKIKSNNKTPIKSFIQKEIQRQCKSILNKESKEMGIKIIRINGNIGIIKCNHVEKNNVIMLLKSINKIGSQDVNINTIATSGTIRSLINKIIHL